MKSVFVVAAAGLASAAHQQTLTVSLSQYPGADDVGVGGFLSVDTNEGGLTIKGFVTGLEASTSGGLHIHSGFTCQDAAQVGGHWYNTNMKDKEDDPWTTNWESDGMGVATPDITVSSGDMGLSAQLAIGHAVVVHDSNGTRVACGVLEPLKGKLVHLGVYPNVNGTQRGLLSVNDMQDTGGKWGIHIAGTVVGMPAGITDKGWHIHDGFSCEDHEGVGGHYWQSPLAADPWVPDDFNSVYTADDQGVAHVDQWFDGFHVHASPNDVVYHTVVFHGEGSTRLLCGTIGKATHAATTMAPYPSYAGNVNNTYTSNGTLVVTVSETEVHMRGYLFNLPPSKTTGIHIHSGYSCDTHSDAGGHWWVGAPKADPWDTTYTSDAQGVAKVDITVTAAQLGLNPLESVAHTIVVHNGAERIGCGVLEPLNGRVAEMGEYPGTMSETEGLVVVDDLIGNLRLRGTVLNLEPSSSLGFHIHAGYSCESNDTKAVGPHYFVEGTPDDWIGVNYKSNAAGVAQIHMLMSGFHVHSSITSGDRLDVSDHTMVAHGTGSARLGCAVIGGQNMAVATIASYPGLSATDAVQGTVISTASMTEVHLAGVLFNLPPSTTSGFHIHAGYSCETAPEVGGHWWVGEPTADPWTTTYTSDENGVAFINITVTKAELGLNPMWAGAHTLVAHNGSAKIGCGVLSPFGGKIAYFGKAGVLAVGPDQKKGVNVMGTLLSMKAGAKSFDVHKDYNCEMGKMSMGTPLLSHQYSDGDDGISQVSHMWADQFFENWIYRAVTTDNGCAMINSQMNMMPVAPEPEVTTTNTPKTAPPNKATSSALAAAPMFSALAALAFL